MEIYNKKSIWKWILLYLIIGAVAYGAIYYFFFYKDGEYSENFQYPIFNYQMKNNTTETADWKTYRNDKAGYEIKYPPNWAFREYPDIKTGAGFRPLSEPNDIAHEFINVDTYNRGTDYCDIPFVEYVKTAFAKEAGSGEAVLISIEKIDNMNSVESYKTIWDEPPHSSDNKRLIIGPITYFGSGKQDCKSPQAILGDNSYLDIYNKMIATFKFTPVE